MRCCVFLMLATFLVAPVFAAAQDSDAHRFCRMSWASEPAKLNACVQDQIAGAQAVIRWLDWAKTSADPAALFIISAFENCQDRWSPDYKLIEACLRAESPLTPPAE